MELFTIGHSNHSIEVFITLLQQHQITALADVRSHPYSRYVPHFNPKQLKPALADANIRYVFLGQELGARPDDPTCYVDDKAVYERIASTECFKEGIQRLVKGAETYKIALMCAEKDPITCHRAILICQYVRDYDLTINHILASGDLESHQQLEERLLKLQGLSSVASSNADQLTLFDQLFGESLVHQTEILDPLEEAYRRQGDQIAYVDKKESHNERET